VLINEALPASEPAALETLATIELMPRESRAARADGFDLRSDALPGHADLDRRHRAGSAGHRQQVLLYKDQLATV
jgi:hypothetical protein